MAIPKTFETYIPARVIKVRPRHLTSLAWDATDLASDAGGVVNDAGRNSARAGAILGPQIRHHVQSLHNLSKFKSVEFEVCAGALMVASQYLSPAGPGLRCCLSPLLLPLCCF